MRGRYGWRTTQLAELLEESQSSSAWQTGDSKRCSFNASRRTLRVFKGNKEMLWGRRLEGYTNWREVSRQGELLSDMNPVILSRRMDKESNRCTEVRKASTWVLGGSIMVPRGFGVVQECREMLWDMNESLARHESYEGAGPEAIRMDNLKTLDYLPVGWKGRLLSPVHLDESKPTWMSSSLVAKPKPG
ncbi:hypothetical protein Acr_18g0011620 [Actinidia rufa]|uniref:Uncharacterized protein n=1 Tax=Actinidia rufa TaxID=165716 RepID=A0A7J0G8D7_9ERIC|nr:hypothetical protein Acr_18g0011620 [Actinidia rufa]